MTKLFIFLRRLKINHVSHEFILEFGTVTNSTYHRYPIPTIYHPDPIPT
jgi:hypothetical protein